LQKYLDGKKEVHIFAPALREKAICEEKEIGSEKILK
jgi:hypothetical protein